MAAVTIIIPVYQAEYYLHRCVDSILSQTYIDYDLVLVDDGASDNSPMICDEYVNRDSRVHVIHQKNSGPSAARNAGIKWAFSHSDSCYLTFVDSDDLLHPQYLEYLLKAVKSFQADIVMCGHQYIKAGQQMEAPTYQAALEAKIISAEDLMLAETSSFNYIWGKLYSKSCFQSLRFPEGVTFGEDNLIIFKALFSAKKLVYVSNELYYYFYTPDGITKSPWTPKSLAVFDGIREQLAFYRENGYERAYLKEQELLVQQYAYQIHRIQESAAAPESKKYEKKLREEMKKAFSSYPRFRPADQYYWLEACYPNAARLWSFLSRIKNLLIK